MENLSKNPTLTLLALVGLVLLAALVFWWGGLGTSGLTQLHAASTASLLTDDTYAIVSDTWTNSLNAGLETAVTGGVCYTTPPATAPVSINGVTVTPLSQAVVPCPAQVGLDQGAALVALNAQICTPIGTNVDLNAIIIGTNPPGTFPPGCYTSSGSMDIVLSTTVTLDATAPGGDGGNVWIFRSGGALTTGANSLVVLANGASAANVFWTPGGAASIGANSSTSATPTFVGTIIADALGSTGINLGHFVNMLGRVLAFGHTVTTDSNTIAVPSGPPPALLHVIKSVVNVSGGAAVASDFTVHLKNAGVDVAGSPALGTSTPGTLYSLPAGTYAVSEDANVFYTQSFGGDCAPGGSVTLASGDEKICTIINTDIPPPPAPQPSIGGGPATPLPLPLIAVTKIPSPLALPGGPGSVTYTYTAKNIGQTTMGGVWVKDDVCNPVTFVSGDNNSNSLLDVNEIWVYHCTSRVSLTTTNTATAHGSANGYDAYDTANATVIVGASIPPPLIKVVKVPSRLIPFPFGGGDVTYTYTVTNPGVATLHDVTVTDDKCAPVSLPSGDSNGNTLLEPSEAWVYTCTTNVPVSTRNTATAEGRANGLIALDYAFTTVLVAAPGLPNTGLPSEGTMVILMLSAILVLVAALFIVILKKRSTIV